MATAAVARVVAAALAACTIGCGGQTLAGAPSQEGDGGRASPEAGADVAQGGCSQGCPPGYACESGACVPPMPLAPHEMAPWGIAADGERVYWTSPGEGAIKSVPRDGGPVTVLRTGEQNPLEIAVDATSLYWTENDTSLVKKAPLGGGQATVIASNAQVVAALAVRRGRAYWLATFPVNAGGVYSVSVEGGAVTLLAPAKSNSASMVVDDSSVYWTDDDGLFTSVSLGGGPTRTLYAAPTAQAALAIALDGAGIYWARGPVQRIPLAGGAPTVVYPGMWDSLGIAVGGSDVYWTNGGVVERAPLGGGPAAMLADDQRSANRIALDDEYVYWTTVGNITNDPDCAIWRAAK